MNVSGTQSDRPADEDQLLRVIADEAPRMLRRIRGGPYFSELLVIPVIENVAGEVIGNDASWKRAGSGGANWLAA